jgi:5,10-methylenetetrahydromethanopterin reductase
VSPLGIGVVLQGAYPPPTFAEMVESIEGLGYSHLWLTDSSLHARNSYAYLTLAATRSSRLRLGTAVTNPLTRHPAVTAVAAATVDEVSNGRMILGIGAGDRPLLALGMRPAKLGSLRAAIGAMRELWAGEDVSVEDPAFELHGAHMRFGSRADIPIYISASGPKTLELAGEVADGAVVLVGLFPEALAWAIERIDRGAASAGRARPHVAVFAYGAIDEDEEAALASARTIAAWFPQTAPVICELWGLEPSLITEVRQRYAGGEFQEAAEAARLLPDGFVRSVALAGDASQARERIRAVIESGADSIHVFPLGANRMGTIEAFAGCFADVTGGVQA